MKKVLTNPKGIRSIRSHLMSCSCQVVEVVGESSKKLFSPGTFALSGSSLKFEYDK
ncbi:MAG: hypothetical protein H6622_05150 [Halobacteriovoraceae bacterium]|nr:hypothetical protein [Halobacteriovoraceae bacterium]